MDRDAAALARRLSGWVVKAASALSPRGALLVIGALFAGFLWVTTVAPPLVSFALTIALAIAWCVWLERQPGPKGAYEAPLDAMGALPPAKPTVQVLATTAEGTKCALDTARRLTSGTDARVLLFVPRLTPFTAPFEPSGQERTATIDWYRQIAIDVGVHVDVLFCVCRRPDDVVHQMLGPSTLLIVGGRSRAWWPTRERRLVERLILEGYPIVFADVGAAPNRTVALP